jgi:hypothetical protein
LIGAKFSTPLICLSVGAAKSGGADLSVEIQLSVASAINRQAITGKILQLDLLIILK